MRLNRVLETCLYTADLERTKEFYQNTLGISFYAEAKARHVFFKMPDGSMLLFFNPVETGNAGQGLPPHFAAGKQHLAFEVTPEDYTLWKDRLIKAQVPIEHEQTWKNGVKSFYFRDPNDHLLEICEPGIWG
jgi:catechol 2,3-dioxygenase-like lactoylglutathione lyase family enzyme